MERRNRDLAVGTELQSGGIRDSYRAVLRVLRLGPVRVHRPGGCAPATLGAARGLGLGLALPGGPLVAHDGGKGGAAAAPGAAVEEGASGEVFRAVDVSGLGFGSRPTLGGGSAAPWGGRAGGRGEPGGGGAGEGRGGEGGGGWEVANGRPRPGEGLASPRRRQLLDRGVRVCVCARVFSLLKQYARKVMKWGR